MATELTRLASAKTSEIIQKPQLVLEIDGIDKRFGLGSIKKYIRVGDPGLVIGDSWVIGGFIEQEDQLDVITLDGTTTQISQQLLQDKGGVSSVGSIAISLIDLNLEITKIITPGVVVDDILGRKARVYLGYQETAFPQDFVQIFAGVIDEVQAGSTIILNIAHPEQKKRGQLFPKVSTTLTADARFRSLAIQGILYRTRRDVVGSVTIEYQNAVTAGSETVSVIGTAITVGIETGVSTNSQIRAAIENSLPALTLVSISILDGQSSTAAVIQLTTALASDTTLAVVETKGLLLPDAANGFRTFVRINDEIIEYTGLTATTITGCTRESFKDRDARAFGSHHSSGDEVESFYVVSGNAIDLTLKMLMGGGPEYFAENVPVSAINEIESVGNIPNAIYFQGFNVQDKYGVIPGDMVTVTGESIPANNVTDAEIIDIVVTEFGSYIVVDAPLATHLTSDGILKFKTQWNLWPENAGLGLGGDEVDVPRFQELKDLFPSSLFDYEFYLTDTVEAKDFMDGEVLFPTGAFTIPRKGKISVGFTSPPVGTFDLKTFNPDNTIRPEQNKVIRGIARYFFNNIVFQYNENLLDSGKLLSGELTVDADSKARIKTSNKSFVIKARGLRPGNGTEDIIRRITDRFLDRYKFAAERIKIKAFYGDGFNSDVGDIVAFGGAELQLPDSSSATRATKIKLYEVVNKTLDITSGVVTFDLVDTNYSVEGARYGVVSPASIVGAGSTTTQLVLENSYGNEPPKKESVKWNSFLGEKVLIHDEAWSYQYERTLVSFAPSDGNRMNINPALPIAPSAGDIVEIISYPDNADDTDSEIYKRSFVFTNPSVQVVSGISATQFTVGAGDAAKFQIDQPLIMHSDSPLGEWLTVSNEVKVTGVSGTTITVEALGLTPDNTFTVELIGYPDGGYPYRFF